MQSPLDVERQFAAIRNIIDHLPSERLKLMAVSDFMHRIEGSSSIYISYLRQLFWQLAPIEDPFNLGGLSPKWLTAVINQLEQWLPSLEDRALQSQLTEVIASYRSVLQDAWLWVGEREKSDGLNEAMVHVATHQVPKAETNRSILIPVVESYMQYHSGRLRRMSLEVVGPAPKTELIPAFGVIGAGLPDFSNTIVQAVEGVLKAQFPRINGWKVVVRSPNYQSWHRGQSGHLALAGALLCEWLRAEGGREEYWISPAACITGDLDKEGSVLEVDPKDLPSKIEAAFFSWAQVLVVPLSQLEEAQQLVEQLAKDFPNRHLPVIGVGHLRELFYDRRIVQSQPVPVLRHQLRQARKKKLHWYAVGMLVLLLGGFAGMKAIGPIDKKPEIIEYAGDYFIVKNARNYKLFEQRANLKNDSFRYLYAQEYAKLIDTDVDGWNEFFWLSVEDSDGSNFHMLLNSADAHGMKQWSKEFVKDYQYTAHPYVQQRSLSLNFITDWNTNTSIEPKLLISAQHPTYFPSHVLNVDPKTGDILDEIIHPGHIRELITEDINDDGQEEIIFGGMNNEFKKANLVIVDQSHFGGQISYGDTYSHQGIPRVKPIVHLLFPQTLLAEYFKSNTTTMAYVSGISYFEKPTPFYSVQVSESIRVNNREQLLLVVYELNPDFTVRSVASSTSYDLLAKELYNQGRLPVLPDGKFMQAYKDSVIRVE